jgi:uncharacterized protein YndB with AHSA1/START domain
VEIDTSAPAVASSEIEVRAPPEIVWRVLTDISGWPSWNPDVKSVEIDGPPVPGTTFRWKAGPSTITSTLRAVEPPRRIAWAGKTLGISAIHVYELDPRDDATLVRSAESWDGLLVRLLRRRLSKTLQETTASGLEHLKREAERQTDTGQGSRRVG